MTILLDQEMLSADLHDSSTLSDALLLVQQRLQNSNRVIVSVDLDGSVLDGRSLTDSGPTLIHNHDLRIATADQTELARTLVGKLAALVEYLTPKHHEAAVLLEQGQTAKALAQLGEILSAWQQIHEAYASLTRMLQLDLDTLVIGEITATERLNQFIGQLQEVQSALQAHDMVLLGDILQYEMDNAIGNWNNLLAATLGIIDGTV